MPAKKRRSRLIFLYNARKIGIAAVLLENPAAAAFRGVEVAFIDTVAEFGHMLEIYPEVPALAKFYRAVRRAAENWDGRRLFVRVSA